MKQYEIKVTQVCYVFVEAEDGEKALIEAYGKALETTPDIFDATIEDCWEEE